MPLSFFHQQKREREMAGMLYLCATPIGNLEDMTLRAVRMLKEVDMIACEDTRTSRKLLDHYEIRTPVTSYHEHNKWEKAEVLVREMLEGADVAVITDAGMPCISDPGEALVKKAAEAGICVSVIPGATASVSALAVSGMDTGRFVFEGFLPASGKERKERLASLAKEERTIILYEAPHRLVRTLADLTEVLGETRKVSLVRELTKRYETVVRSDLAGLSEKFSEEEPKGECVLVLAGADHGEVLQEERSKWEEIPLQEHYEKYLRDGLDRKEAMKQVAKDRGVPKREIYQALNSTEKGNR